MSEIRIGWCWETGRRTEELVGERVGYKFCNARGEELGPQDNEPTLVRVWADNQTIIVPYAYLTDILMM